MVFHTHPFSTILGNKLLLQLPSNFDVAACLNNNLVVGDSVKETFIFTLGGFYSLTVDESCLMFLDYHKQYYYEYYKKTIKDYYNHIFSFTYTFSELIKAELGELFNSYMLIKHTGKKVDFKVYENLIKVFSQRSCNHISSLTLDKLFEYEETITATPILRSLFKQFQVDENFPFDENKISIFNLQFFSIDKKAERDGLEINIQNSFQKVIKNEPPIDTRIKKSPIGNCEREFTSVWFNKDFMC
jgi:hypothetical protein